MFVLLKFEDNAFIIQDRESLIRTTHCTAEIIPIKSLILFMFVLLKFEDNAFIIQDRESLIRTTHCTAEKRPAHFPLFVHTDS
jgi:ribosomal protein L14